MCALVAGALSAKRAAEKILQPRASSSEGIWTRLKRPPDGAAFGSGPITILASAIAFWCLLALLQYSRWLIPRATKLSREHILEWNIRVVSTVHAVILGVGSVLCFWSARNLSDEECIFGYSFYPDFFARIFLGYLIHDLGNLGVFFKTLRDFSGMIHHALFIYVTAYVLAHSLMRFPFAWLSLAEISTPFVNARWALAVLDRKDGWAYIANGLALATTFFVARVVVYGAGLAHLWRIRGVWLRPDVPSGHKLCVLIFVLGYLLNLYWFLIIARAVRRALVRQEKKAR